MLDQQTILSEDQDLAQAAGTYASTNSYDLGAPGTDALGNTVAHDAGQSNIPIEVRVTTAFASAGAATVQVQVIQSANADLSSPDVLFETPAIAKATLVAGYRFQTGSLPPGVTKRYIGVQYVIGTATTTAGKCTAYIPFTATK